MTVREALRDAMAEEMRRDDDVFVMGEEVAEYQGAYKVTPGPAAGVRRRGASSTRRSPSTASPASASARPWPGLKPIVEFMTFNFAMQAIDQIINSAAKTLYMSGGQMGCPIVFRGPNGAAARVAAQHSQDYAAWYAPCPRPEGRRALYAPPTPRACSRRRSAIPNPVIFLENEILYGQSFDVPKLDDFVLPIGKARIAQAGQGRDHRLVRHRHDLCAEGRPRSWREEGIEAEVIDLRTLRPMDIDTVVASVKKTNRCVTVEEGWPQSSASAPRSPPGSWSRPSTISTRRCIAIAGKDVPMPYAANLEKLALPNVGEVVEAVKAVTYR